MVGVLKQFRSDTPDAIFPNNLLFVTELDVDKSGGREYAMVLSAMKADNRQWERNEELAEGIMAGMGGKENFVILDLAKGNKANEVNESGDIIGSSGIRKKAGEEFRDKYDVTLEGTGSIVVDQKKKVMFALTSPRTDRKALSLLEQATGYEVKTYSAIDKSGKPMYHTNVHCEVYGGSFAVYCKNPKVIKESGVKANDHKKMVEYIEKNYSKENRLVISKQQMDKFAGNMKVVLNTNGEEVLALSKTAWNSLSDIQKDKLKNKFSDNIVVAKLDVIEALGGGSARCMLTDILCKNIEQAESVLRETGASLRKFGGKTEEHLVVYSLTPQKTLSISAMKNVNNHQMEMGYKFGTA